MAKHKNIWEKTPFGWRVNDARLFDLVPNSTGFRTYNGYTKAEAVRQHAREIQLLELERDRSMKGPVPARGVLDEIKGGDS